MSDHELSRLLATVESLQAQYEQARKDSNEAASRKTLVQLELALAQIERLTAPSR